MLIKIISLALGLFALFLTFRVRWVLSAVFKIDEPTDKMILNVKYAALGIAVLAFLMTFLADKL